MKISRMIISIVGIALTSVTFGQLLSEEDGNHRFHTLSYNSASDRLLNHQLNEVPERRAYGDQFDAPLNSIVFFEPMEKDIDLENWMVVPFNINDYEEELFVEPWMTEPFTISDYEAELSIEPWMTSPFILEEDIQVEEWMLSAWF